VDLGLFGSSVIVGGRAYTVRPPDVRTAVAVLSALRAGDYRLVREAVTGWLPLSLVSVLFSLSVSPSESVRVIERCLTAGSPEATREAQAEAKEDALDKGWGLVLAEYRYAFKADVMREPWPLFLHQLAELRRVQAREMLRNARWYGAVKVGGDALDALVREAQIEAEQSVAVPAHLTGAAGREYVRDKVAEFQRKMRRGGKPVAEA
jgi:hypothetical protein